MGDRRRNVDPAPQGVRRGGLPLADRARLRHSLEAGGDLGAPAAEGAERFLDRGPARLRLGRGARRLVQLSPEGDDRGLALGGEAGVRRLGLQRPGQLGRLLGGPPHLRLLGVQLGDAAADPVALGCHGRLRGESRLHLQLAEPRLLAGKRGEPALGRLYLPLEAARLGDGDAQGAGDPPLRSHPLQGIGQPLGRLGRGRALGAGVDQPLQRLTQASGLLGGRLGRGQLQALLTQPGGGAEDRLVDPEVEAARAHRPPDPKLLGDVTTAQLLDLGLHPVPVEGLGHAEALPTVQPVGEGQPEAPRRPGEPACPVAPVAGPPRPARLQAVEGGADGAVQGRLAGLVGPDHDRDPLPEVEAALVQPPKPGDLQPLQPHRSPTSPPAKASSP